jgi:hypothetical protein
MFEACQPDWRTFRMLPPIYTNLNTRNLEMAMLVLRKYSRTAPGEALPRTVAFIVKDAKEHTPFTEMGRIDTELQVDTTPVISSRTGKPLKSGRKSYSVTEGGLATKIVLARMRPYSNYNVLTDRKYALDQANFSPGAGEAGFWAQVEAVAQRMVASRHSSTHFFQVSWNAVLASLVPFVPDKYRGAVATWSGKGRKVVGDLGAATMGGIGTTFATCVIENRVGMDDEFPTISAIRNMEAHRILEPVLQDSIDSEFQSAMSEIGRRGLLETSPQLAGLGVLVT